jgi:Uri superfamily endonuclease
LGRGRLVNDELKPCPFCGSSFIIGQEPYDNAPVAGMYYIYHDYGPIGSAARKCIIKVDRHFNSANEAMVAWNTRDMRERERIVTLIRTISDEIGDEIADRIEVGEHLK